MNANDPPTPALNFEEWGAISLELLDKSTSEQQQVLARRSVGLHTWESSNRYWLTSIAHELTRREVTADVVPIRPSNADS